MILQDITEKGLSGLFAPLGGLFLVCLGFIWIIFALHEAVRRKSFLKKKVEDWDFPITKFLKILSLSGIIVGVLSILAGIGSLLFNEAPSLAYQAQVNNTRNIFTCFLLIILGILTFFKPLNDLPIASTIGVLVSSVVCIIILFLIPDSAIKLIDARVLKIGLIIIFLIIFAIVAITVKFWTAGIMGVSKILSWPPLALIIALLCLIQGFMLLVLGISMIP